MRFSLRFARKSGEKSLVLEDAPKPTRIGYIKGVLTDFVGNSGNYGRRKEPLDAYETHEKFCALIRDEANPWDYDNENSWMSLTAHLKGCTWLEFYDFVEMVGKHLTEVDQDPFITSTQFWFKAYQTRLNALLEEDGIGWSLNDAGELHRQMPKALEQRVVAASSSLSGRYDAARGHYQKSLAYLYKHPIDEANAVKEIVSALESVAKVIAPGSATLGSAIKAIRKRPGVPKYLMDSVEKLYVYSNDTPMIRHGHVTTEMLTVAEAELAVHIGIAFIRYLIDTESKNV
jgi:hypothetical protein